MKLMELINSFFVKNFNEPAGNNSTTIPEWLIILLLITVFLAIIICILATIIAISKTKKKVKIFNEEQNENFSSTKIENSSINFCKNKHNEIDFEKTFLELKNIAEKKDLLEFELVDIKVIKIKIINYMKKNNIKTINDLFNLKEADIKKIIANFPDLPIGSTKNSRENFLVFLNQIQDFIENKKEK